MYVCIQQQAGYNEENKERVLGSWSTEPPGTSQSIFLLPILRSGWGCITTQNTQATLKCYVPHSTVWTSSSHDKLFAWRSVLWRWFVAAHVVGQQIKRKEKDSHTIRTATQSGSHTIRTVTQSILSPYGRHVSVVQCCFTSTETLRLLGMGAQDGHLTFT